MTTFIIVIVIIGALWIILKQSKSQKTSIKEDVSSEKKEIEEETVFKIQEDFEKKLEDTFLPDALSGKEIYIYKNLMNPWYDKLSSKYRYNEKMSQKLKNDFIDYMTALEDRNTYNFLSLEADNEEKEELYRNDHIIASKKAFAIEEAFASSIGDEATKKLTKIRKSDSFNLFSRKGEIAPKGFEFDRNDKLRKKKSK